MKIEAWLKEAKGQVPALDAELLLVWALGEGEAAGGAREAEGRATPGESGLTLDRSYLAAHGEEELSVETQARLGRRWNDERRASRWRISWGRRSFMGGSSGWMRGYWFPVRRRRRWWI